MFVNVGPRTAPETFRFRNNAWYQIEGSGRKPALPTPEDNGIYNVKVSVDTQSLQQGIVQVEDPKLHDYVGAQSYKSKSK